MRMRMALWSTLGAVWFLTTVTLAQRTQPKTVEPTTAEPAAGATATPAKGASAAPVKKGAPAAGATAAPTEGATVAPTAGTEAPAEGPASNAAIDAGTYTVRLRDLEQRINELKERIFRSKSRLSLVGEAVLPDVVGGSKTVIVHRNRMGSSYNLVAALYVLDGTPIFNRSDEDGGLAKLSEFDVFNGRIVPGQHSLEVTLKYRGNGIGPFSYLKDYRITVTERQDFSAPPDTAVDIKVNAYEKGGPTTAIGDRPTVGFRLRLTDVAPDDRDEAPVDTNETGPRSDASGAAGASGSASASGAQGSVGLAGALGGQ